MPDSSNDQTFYDMKMGVGMITGEQDLNKKEQEFRRSKSVFKVPKHSYTSRPPDSVERSKHYSPRSNSFVTEI